jgi:hypothetical protein
MSEYAVDELDGTVSSAAALELRALIRARIRSGRLPSPQGHRLFGGKGDGALCACCDRFITSAEIQFDIESPRAGDWVSHPMHLDCFELWRHESEAISARRARDAEEPRHSLAT